MNSVKSIVGILASACWIGALLLISSCGGDSPEPQQTEIEKATKLLLGTWKVQSVVVDGTDQTSIYKDLSITFSNTTITSINGGSIWPASTTWQFTDDTAKTILRGDGLSISVNELTETKFISALTWTKTTLGGGRKEAVSGQHVFTFSK